MSEKRVHRVGILVAAVVIALFLLAGCGVGSGGGNGGGGEEAAPAVPWPSDVPAGVPPFAYGKIVEVLRSDATDRYEWDILLSEVQGGALARYRDDLSARGWEIATYAEQAPGGLLGARLSNLTLSLVVGGEGSGSLSILETR